MKLSPTLRAWTPVALACTLLTCGGGGSPTAPPTPGPPPSPTPAPTPAPVRTLCDKLGTVPSADARCGAEGAHFQMEVDAAIDKLVRERPELFESGSSGLRIRSVGSYYVGVLANLNAMDVCAGYDGEEVQVKDSNDFNDQYDISTSSGYVRRDNNYQSTCRPAAFPAGEPAPIPPPAGCTLPPSHEVACGPESASFLDDLDQAIDEVVRDHPEYFDLNQYKNGNWYKVVNTEGYLRGVEGALVKRGYCGRWDGEEMVVKKTNDFSDHYDILTGDNFIRRGPNNYQVTCYPAAF